MVGERHPKLLGLARERLEGQRDVAERPIARREAGVLPDALWRDAGSDRPAEGKESTLVGLSIPRQRALSARNVELSARQRLTTPP